MKKRQSYNDISIHVIMKYRNEGHFYSPQSLNQFYQHSTTRL